jgi:hypothetical protein
VTNTLKQKWEMYLNEVLVPTAQRQNLPPLPPKIVESFRRCFYCGAATIFMSIVKADATWQDGPMDADATFKELREFAAEMRTL